MPFSHVWDNTFPPDTQLANLLGDDIRTLKEDIQQRMAAISGLDANKPTFEAGFAGVLYFTTDTGKVYQWSGSAWVDVTQATIGNVVINVAPTIPLAKYFIQNGSAVNLSQAIPAGDLAVGKKVSIYYQAQFLGNQSLGSNGIILKLNGNTILNTSNPNAVNGDIYTLKADIVITGASAEYAIGDAVIAGIFGAIKGGSGAISSALAVAIAGGFTITTEPTNACISGMIVSVL